MNLQIVIPCYNQELVLPDAARKLDAVLNRLIESNKITNDSRIILIDDGSRDRTWALLVNRIASASKWARAESGISDLICSLLPVFSSNPVGVAAA
jgi:glycosyltransferase involved in cell wall biosynthesis